MVISELYNYNVLEWKNENTLQIKTNEGEELQIKQLARRDDNHVLFNTHGMYYKEFPSDFSKVRAYSSYIIQYAPELYKEVNLLEQQISEVIKNAIEQLFKSSKKDYKIKPFYIPPLIHFSTDHAPLKPFGYQFMIRKYRAVE